MTTTIFNILTVANSPLKSLLSSLGGHVTLGAIIGFFVYYMLKYAGNVNFVPRILITFLVMCFCWAVGDLLFGRYIAFTTFSP